MVDFDIVETIEYSENNNWKDEDVCPWCYNQLIEKKTKTPKPHQ